MAGTYLSERHGDHYQVWFIDADGDHELIAEGSCDPAEIAHRVADVEAHHRWILDLEREADQ